MINLWSILVFIKGRGMNQTGCSLKSPDIWRNSLLECLWQFSCHSWPSGELSTLLGKCNCIFLLLLMGGGSFENLVGTEEKKICRSHLIIYRKISPPQKLKAVELPNEKRVVIIPTVPIAVFPPPLNLSYTFPSSYCMIKNRK